VGAEGDSMIDVWMTLTAAPLGLGLGWLGPLAPLGPGTLSEPVLPTPGRSLTVRMTLPLMVAPPDGTEPPGEGEG
jgi:hypothetical protein